MVLQVAIRSLQNRLRLNLSICFTSEYLAIRSLQNRLRLNKNSFFLYLARAIRSLQNRLRLNWLKNIQNGVPLYVPYKIG